MGRIQRRHLCLSCDLGGSLFAGALAIPRSKTQNRTVHLQSVLIEDELVLALLNRVCAGDAPTQLLIPGGLHGLQRRFDLAKRALGISASSFNLGGLRGGGAIEYFMRTHQIQELRFRGRWESERSLNHYVQLGLAATAYADLPASARFTIRQLACLAPELISVHNLHAN